MAIKLFCHVSINDEGFVRRDADHATIGIVEVKNVIMPCSFKIIVRAPQPNQLGDRWAREFGQRMKKISDILG